MELREFVSETIQQISLGIKDAMDRCSELDVIVNPDITVGSNGHFTYLAMVMLTCNDVFRH